MRSRIVMKYKNILILVLLHFSIEFADANRIITSDDIARWYLDANLVAISTLLEIDTILLRTVDTIGMGERRIHYDIVKERYRMHIDSIIKGHSHQDTIIVETPEHPVGCYEYTIKDSGDMHISETGDTMFISVMEMFLTTGCTDSYFKVLNSSASIVFLKLKDGYFETYYVDNEISERSLSFLREVDAKGEAYFKRE